MYATVVSANKNIYDIHLPDKSRVNIVESPLGADITIRNFKQKAMSIIDLINIGELSYNMAGRFWLYAEGMKIRPANMLIGGMPAAGKTTLLNSMFSFFRPEQRIVTIEDTYELNTETQENCVRLETSTEVSLEELVQNSLRMRPDMLILGEVRGKEAKDMMTAMNIGKITMSTIHASTARDVITRLEHTPMNIEKDIIPLIDAIVLVSQINIDGKFTRKITQISEISGIETQVLLSDLYKYDYKTRKGSDILPSVTYRDTLATLSGVPPSDILREERRRAIILESMNKKGVRGLKQINEMCREYYDNPNRVLKKLDINDSV
jgi:flagellar protein FlaI